MPTPSNRGALAPAQAAAELAIYVTPRAGRTEVAGDRDGAIWLRLAAPPVDGAANDALLRYLAQRLGVPRSALLLVAGQTGRRKRVSVAGMDADTVRQRLGLPDREAATREGVGLT